MSVPARYLVGIARYTDADAADLRAFQERMYGEGARQLDRERFAWLFERNPCRSPEGPGLWICRRDGAIVGQQAEIPFDLRVGVEGGSGGASGGSAGESSGGGVVRPAAWTIDLMVDDAWRMRGVGPGLVATQLAERGLAGGLNLSDKGRRTYERGGWTDLGVVPVYIRPLDAGRAMRLARLPARLRRLAPIAGPALRAADALLAGAARGLGLRLEPVERFGSEVDEVWAAAAPDYPVLAVRDAATIRWRLDDRPDRDRLRRFVLRRGPGRGRGPGAALGYVAFRPTVGSPDPAAVVVDYLAPVRWVAPLLTLAGLAARRDGAVALVCKTRNAGADRSLRRAGFVRREQGTDPPIRFMFRCAESEGPEVARLVNDPDAWLVTSADSDLEYATTPASSSSMPAPSPSPSPSSSPSPSPSSNGRRDR